MKAYIDAGYVCGRCRQYMKIAPNSFEIKCLNPDCPEHEKEYILARVSLTPVWRQKSFFQKFFERF